MSGFYAPRFNSLHPKSIWQLLQTYINACSTCTVVHKSPSTTLFCSRFNCPGLNKGHFHTPYWIHCTIGHSVDHRTAVGQYYLSTLIELWPISTGDFLQCGRQCKTTPVSCRCSHPEPHKDSFTVVSAYHKTIHSHSCGFYKSHLQHCYITWLWLICVRTVLVDLKFKLLPSCVH